LKSFNIDTSFCYLQDIDSMVVMTKLGGSGGSLKPPKDLTGNLPADQLHQMFPTPPSHEHPNIASPADLGDADLHYGSSVQVYTCLLGGRQFM
jgi:hypothetical protein